jgi:hypothetical protein
VENQLGLISVGMPERYDKPCVLVLEAAELLDDPSGMTNLDLPEMKGKTKIEG